MLEQKAKYGDAFLMNFRWIEKRGINNWDLEIYLIMFIRGLALESGGHAHNKELYFQKRNPKTDFMRISRFMSHSFWCFKYVFWWLWSRTYRCQIASNLVENAAIITQPMNTQWPTIASPILKMTYCSTTTNYCNTTIIYLHWCNIKTSKYICSSLSEYWTHPDLEHSHY